MTVVLAGLACGVAGVALAALVYERQLRRLARSLRERDAHSNTRLTVEAPGRGFAELAAAVNGQLDAAQKERVEALRRQREFQRDLASLSHDVRTPLMGAKGYVRLAQDGRERPGGEEAVARHLAAAEARLDDMGALLDQLFAYAQASDPDLALDLRPVRVLPLLADVLVGHYPAFDERGWEPQVDFEDEALALEGREDVRADASAPVVGFTTQGEVAVAFEEAAEELEGKGWTQVESGMPACGTFVKRDGTYRWLFVSGVQVGKDASMVVHYDGQLDGKG